MDNLRRFKTADGHEDNSGTVGTVATLAPTKTTRPTSAATAAVETSSAVTTTSGSTELPTDAVVDPTVNRSSQNESAIPSAPDAEQNVGGKTERADTPWLLIGIGAGAVVLIAGGMALFLVLRKKKTA